MPELPEVEIIKRDLDKKIRGKKLQEIITNNQKMFTPNFSLVRKKIKNQTVIKLERRGKLLIMNLPNSWRTSDKE